MYSISKAEEISLTRKASIIFHQIIENQLESREPVEAFQFYNSMKKSKISRHEAIHGKHSYLRDASRRKSHLGDAYIVIALLDGSQVYDGTACEIGM